MIETITLDTRKGYSPGYKLRISPLRRGERGNVTLTVAVRCDRTPYDLTGMTAHLVWSAADGKLVGPVPMEVADPVAGTVRCTLPDACYAAVGTARAYIELRRGAELVDTTDEVLIKVLDCIDADAEQAEEYKPLIGEVRDATDAAKSAAERAESGEDERIATEAERVAAESARKQAETERTNGWADLKADAEKTVGDAVKRADSAADRATQAAVSASAAGDAATAAAAKANADTKAAVDSASASVSKAVADAKADVDAAVGRSDAATAKADEAVETANTANTSATQAVTDAQAAISEVKATEAKLYPAAENVLKGTAKDTFVHVDDAFSGAALREITVEGACKQDGTPSPDNPVPIQVIEHPVVNLTGMNLLDPAKMADGAYYEDVNGELRIKGNDGRVWETVPVYGKLAAGKYDVYGDSFEVRANGVSLVYTEGIESSFTLAAESDVKIKVGFGKNGTYPFVSHVVLRVSDDAPKSYTHYTSQSLAFTLPSEHPYLAKLPSGMADTIEVDADGNVDSVARVGMNAQRTAVAPIPETRYPLGKINMPKAQDSIVNVWTDAEVTPRTGIEYTRDVNIVVSNLESAIASITKG